MRAFTHDVESVELTSDECCAYVHLVQFNCVLDELRGITSILEMVSHRWTSEQALNAAQCQARRMWRTVARL
jgi:hypothetical protein